MEIFELAARRKFRFKTEAGTIAVEDLFDLPLRAGRGHPVSLDTVAKAVHAELKSVTEESFVDTKVDPRKGDLEIKLDIVKHVIATKIEAEKKVADLAERALKRRKLVDALASKEDEKLNTMTSDEILAELAKIDEAA